MERIGLQATYRLNWAWRTSWGWWDEWDDTALQTQDSKFKPWSSDAEYSTSRSRRLPTILSFTSGRGRNIFVSFKPPRPGNKSRALAWKATVLTTTLGALCIYLTYSTCQCLLVVDLDVIVETNVDINTRQVNMIEPEMMHICPLFRLASKMLAHRCTNVERNLELTKITILESSKSEVFL